MKWIVRLLLRRNGSQESLPEPNGNGPPDVTWLRTNDDLQQAERKREVLRQTELMRARAMRLEAMVIARVSQAIEERR